MSGYLYRTNSGYTEQDISAGNSKELLLLNEDAGLLHWVTVKVKKSEWVLKIEVNDVLVCSFDLEMHLNEFQFGDFYTPDPVRMVKVGGRHVLTFYPKEPLHFTKKLNMYIERKSGENDDKYIAHYIGYSL